MVEFLIKRPIGVLASLIAILVLGILAAYHMPVSLLPELDVPEITIHLKQADNNARQLENTVVAPIRNQLAQLNNLHTIESTTKDGSATINLRFKHGTRIQYAFLETNEKVDALAGLLPDGMARPIVLKTSPSDIPVFYLRLSRGKQIIEKPEDFLDLSDYVDQVVRRRLEQLSDVSFVDINGLEQAEIALFADEGKMNALGIKHEDIIGTLQNNNVPIGSLLFQDGQYQYHVRVGGILRNLDDIRNLVLSKNNRQYTLSEFVHVSQQPKKREGFNLFMGNQAITMTIYKQADARMQDMQTQVKKTIAELTIEYPDIQFDIGRDQATLLRVSLENLQQTLFLGILFSVIVVFGFMRSRSQPLLIALTIPVALVVAVFFLYLSGISINTISLAGLILGVGMMIDNAIIVTDNINQWRERGASVDEACIAGTNEVIRPLISSTLTTCVVFVPLVFLSGIAGALFFEQAVAVALSLSSSLLVSILVLPVLYKASHKVKPINQEGSNMLAVKWYERFLMLVMNNRLITLLLFLLFIPIGYFTFVAIDKKAFPDITQTDVIVKIDWHEPITAFENKERALSIVRQLQSPLQSHEMFIGSQQFVFFKGIQPMPNESELYFQVHESGDLSGLVNEIDSIISYNYPLAELTYKQAENIFDMVFSQSNAPLTARFHQIEDRPVGISDVTQIALSTNKLPENLKAKMRSASGSVVAVYPDFSKMPLYDVDYKTLLLRLELLFGNKYISEIKEGGYSLPIVFSSSSESFLNKVSNGFVTSKKGHQIPLSAILYFDKATELKSIMADNQGEYIAVDFEADYSNFRDVIKKTNIAFDQLNENLYMSWHGALFNGLNILKELLVVLLVAFLLLYFILAAQFESLVQPIIVLFELVFGASGALLFLWFFNESLNIMSMIGIIVMSGIIINDSILKIDTINRLRKQGFSLLESIIEGGKRRFKPIMMTSVTTVLALIPLMFIHGIGSDLQLPLALSIIGGLIVGTIVSLYFIPILYYYFYASLIKKNDKLSNEDK